MGAKLGRPETSTSRKNTHQTSIVNHEIGMSVMIEILREFLKAFPVNDREVDDLQPSLCSHDGSDYLAAMRSAPISLDKRRRS